MPARIGITLGDPSGVGPTLCVSTLAGAARELAERVVVFGDGGVLARCGALPRWVQVRDVTTLAVADAAPGSPTLAGARAQVAYVEAALAAARAGEIGALVTAPVAKTQLVRAGCEFTGHTEWLAARLGARRSAMMFAGPSLRVVLTTVHVPLREVAERLTVARVRERIELGAEALSRDFGIARPRIGVVGLNPHAGEGGLFGREEIDVLAPAIAEAAAVLPACVVTGPLVPDAAFRAARDGAYDLLVAHYHDQALIPLKLVDFEEAVNVTLGLPIVRTSPDHGVAYDIAGTDRVRDTSFRAALDLAATLLARRARRP
jgi:4-hydroxythreonine-4-phosphate dehydrogenase